MKIQSQYKASTKAVQSLYKASTKAVESQYKGIAKVVLIQKRQFLMGTNAVQGSTAKIDILLCDSAKRHGSRFRMKTKVVKMLVQTTVPDSGCTIDINQTLPGMEMTQSDRQSISGIGLWFSR